MTSSVALGDGAFDLVTHDVMPLLGCWNSGKVAPEILYDPCDRFHCCCQGGLKGRDSDEARARGQNGGVVKM